MGSVLPSLTHAQQQREATGTSGDLVEFKLVQKRKAAHKSLKRWFKCDTTLAPLRAQWSVQPLSPEEGAGLQLCIPPGMLRAEGQFLNDLTKARMSRLPEQWKCRLLFYLFFSELMLEDHRQGLLPCTLIHLPHDNLLLLPKFIWGFIFAKLYFTFDSLYLALIWFLECLQSG